MPHFTLLWFPDSFVLRVTWSYIPVKTANSKLVNVGKRQLLCIVSYIEPPALKTP